MPRRSASTTRSPTPTSARPDGTCWRAGPAPNNRASERLLRLRIEQVQALGVECQLELIVGAHANVGSEPRPHQRLADARVEQDLRAELLDHLDLGLQAVIGRV